jgi:hypothetical protein
MRTMRAPIWLLIPALSTLLSGCAAPDKTDPPSRGYAHDPGKAGGKHRVCAVTIAVIKNRQVPQGYRH